MDEYQIQNIALKTLKQRCEYLQRRLNAVEEENCKLKLGKAQDLNSKTSTKDANGLEQRIILLSEEKSQMAYQIQMLRTENLNLWSHLTEILPRNNISDVMFSVSVPQDNQQQKFHHLDSSSKDLCDYDKESLEEISLKLINGIIIDKNELEKQYSQMVDLQSEDISEGKTSSFMNKQLDNRAAIKNLRNYVQKLKDFRKTLYEQRNELSSAISHIKTSKIFSDKRINTNNRSVSDCESKGFNKRSEVNINQSGSELSTSQNTKQKKNEEEKSGFTGICPLCGESVAGSFHNLYGHVSKHFEDGDDEFESANSGFKVI